MNTSESHLENRINPAAGQAGRLGNAGNVEAGFFSRDLVDSLNSTPLGRLLRMIGSLPEIRRDKVMNIRQKIDHGQYDLNENLDAALDMVLEEFIIDG